MPKLELLVAKLFTEDTELRQMKISLAELERKITIKIQENQLKQQQAIAPEPIHERPVIQVMESATNGYYASEKSTRIPIRTTARQRSRIRL